jgi:hypothetical protein
MINIDKAFSTENRSVFEYFQSPGVGFYIPLYQREYSWDNDNVEQLLEDITKGIESIIEDDENGIRFLGTIITVTETDKNKVQPQDTKALPSSIEKIIDGQQRLSTIALFSALLVSHVNKLEKSLEKTLKQIKEDNDFMLQVNEICKFWRERLYDIFSVDLKRGRPTRKAKIIRGSIDKWVTSEDVNKSYTSSVSKHLFEFIQHYFENEELPKFDKNTKAGSNISFIDSWIKKSVLKAHDNQNGFKPAKSILEKIDQESLWQYERESLAKLITSYTGSISEQYISDLCSLVQLLSVCHFLLDRCCFTIIQPINDDWAFDMFQSLNATGTPLTAIETFKPLVVNTVELEGREFKLSTEEEYFTKVEDCFEDSKNSAHKSKLTNDLLTSFALPVDGTKLSTHFSHQRKWLEKIYDKQLPQYDKKKKFICFLGNYSEFYNKIWNKYKGFNNSFVEAIQSHPEADLVSMLLLYLIESNHKMSITILGSFYDDLIENRTNSLDEFVHSVKTIAAFYTLWRSSRSNAGLDDVYRAFFRGSTKRNINAHTWLGEQKFKVSDFKIYLKNILLEEGIQNKEDWKKAATSYLKYDNVTVVCRFALFICSHDTIADITSLGLMKKGTNNCNPYLRLSQWLSSDLKTIEHIAPETQSSSWDNDIYDDQLFHSIGNLTLMPQNINSSLSNRGWTEKLLYYQHLGNKDPEQIKKIAEEAKSAGIQLKNNTTELLQSARHASHVTPIISLGSDRQWNSVIIKSRTDKMLDLLWEQLSVWI